MARDRTDELWAAGQAATEAGRWEDAWVAFKQAHALNPTLKVQYNLGLAALYTERYVEAARLLRQVTLNCDETCPAKVKEIAPLRLKTAQAQVGRIRLAGGGGTVRVLVDDESVDQAVAEDGWYVAPGRHKVVLQSSERSQTSHVDLAPGGVAIVQFAPAVSASDVPPANVTPPSPGEPRAELDAVSGRTITVIVGASLTAVAAGVATAYTFEARSANRQADQLESQIGGPSNTCSSQPTEECARLRDAQEQRDSAARIGKAGWITTGILGVATLATYLLWDDSADSRALRLVPTVDTQFGGAFIYGAF